MITENQVPATLVLQIEAMIAVGGLSPAQAGTFRQAADRIEKQDKRISELEAKLERVLCIKYHTHPSWNCSKEFDAGWRSCREQIDDCIQEALADD